MADVRGLLQTTYENGWTDRVLAEHLEASDLQITRWQLGQERPDSPAVLSLALGHFLEQGQEPDNDCRRRDWEPVVHRAGGGTGGQTGPAGFPHGGSESLGVGEGSARPVGVSVAGPGRGGGSPGGEAEGVGQGQGGDHPFLKVKRLFGYAKVRYRGLAKNTQRLALLLGLGKLMTAEGHLGG